MVVLITVDDLGWFITGPEDTLPAGPGHYEARDMKTSWQQVRKEHPRIGVFIRIQTYQRKERQMRRLGIAAVAALLVSNTWALQVVGAVQTENTPANENRKEQSHMTDEKVIMMIEAKIQAQRRAELIDALHEYLPLVRAEPGVEAFYVTARKDDPNTFVFYEIYKSQAVQDFHLQQEFTKKFLATLKTAQAADRVRTNLVELPLK